MTEAQGAGVTDAMQWYYEMMAREEQKDLRESLQPAPVERPDLAHLEAKIRVCYDGEPAFTPDDVQPLIDYIRYLEAKEQVTREPLD